MLNIKEDERGIILKVKVQPRSAKNEVAGVLGDALKLRITAPPVDGEANESCCKFLSKIFKVAKSQVILLSGQTGRNKQFRILGVNKERARKALRL